MYDHDRRAMHSIYPLESSYIRLVVDLLAWNLCCPVAGRWTDMGKCRCKRAVGAL